ncbi:THAP domain-containing protein 1-like [Polyergus mexicanus]|uniref:THAP domain-containing protein 1-like n=1 Tax=Polyergus mexicanus TaxID=615972 RepID=UPI0038B593CE
MPGCCVPGCSNSTVKGFSMRSFPTDRERKALWITNIGIANWEPKTNSRICEIHFSKDMWEKVRCDGKRKLKCNAVPTIFPPYQLDKNILFDNHDKGENDIDSDNLMGDKKSNIHLLPISQVYLNASMSTNLEEEINWKKQCEELKDLLRKSEQTCKRLQNTMKRREEMFNRIIVKSDRYRRILKERLKRLRESNQNYEKLRINLEKVFKKDQIIILSGDDCKYEAIMQAIDSRHICGNNKI